MILFLSVFSVSCSVIGCWWLGWGHVPKERRLPIGFLSAHVSAATVHVLSRVSPITLALSLSLTIFIILYSILLSLHSYSWCFYSVSPFLCSSSYIWQFLICSTTLCFFFLSLSFSPVTLSYVLPPSVFTSPPTHRQFSFLSAANIFSVSPDFELQAMLSVSFPIYHYPSRE